MTNKQIYEIAERLGMIESNEKCSAIGINTVTDAEIFERDTSKDLVATINFVDDLTIYNDLETIKKLLVVIIAENK